MTVHQILKHFPGRKLGTLQFRYYTVLRDSTSKSSVISSHSAINRNNTTSSSPHSDRQQRIDSLSQSTTESTLRSRYGPARRRRTVEHYSTQASVVDIFDRIKPCSFFPRSSRVRFTDRSIQRGCNEKQPWVVTNEEGRLYAVLVRLVRAEQTIITSSLKSASAISGM